ncbi:hypothetical protein Tsubulata_031153 [Turnera subulata]|uniref:KIB1-4 beta-propeller domain-containing protein n=1 Tax=Turnera subulata TaxID=218843 RepID=A0A9Q0GM17_9ROSI|nr:hypothetical protein Tsubulata_031153 [Turnera subulata]
MPNGGLRAQLFVNFHFSGRQLEPVLKLGGFPESIFTSIDLNDPASPKRLFAEPEPIPLDPYQLEEEVYGDGVPSLTCRKYLAQSPQGDLLLVLRYIDEYRTLGFHVYKLCFDQQRKVVAEEFNLDDTTLFAARGESFTVPVREYPGLMPNSVYFFGFYEIGFYNLPHRAFTHFYQPFEILRKHISSITLHYLRRLCLEQAGRLKFVSCGIMVLMSNGLEDFGFSNLQVVLQLQKKVVAEEFNLDDTALFIEDGASFTVLFMITRQEGDLGDFIGVSQSGRLGLKRIGEEEI